MIQKNPAAVFSMMSMMFLMITALHAEIIPSDRKVNWQPGIPGGIPDYPVSVNVKGCDAVGDGQTDDTNAFQQAISSAPEGTAVWIPDGVYKITSTLNINKGIALRGEGYAKTRLKLDTSDNCISISGEYPGSWEDMTGGYTQGSTQVIVANASIFKAGDYVATREENDTAVYQQGRMTGWLSSYIHGQFLKVTNVSGDTLTLNRPLYFTYKSALNPQIAKRSLIEGVGIEYLTVQRDRPHGVDGGDNIAFYSTANCWVRDVWSEKGAHAHLSLRRSYRNEIRGCVFNDATVSGDGGQGYGVSVGRNATDCLIENNIFIRLRHSLIIQTGASGNVFSYNYSRDPYRDQDPTNPSYDIAVHGHYATMNLFEGNTTQRGTIDNVWGTNGPTTFFRNRFEKHPSTYPSAISKGMRSNNDPFCHVQENNPYHNIIGNEIGIAGAYATSGALLRVDSDHTSTQIVHGNYIFKDGTLQWDPDIADHELPDSYYLNEKPAFFGDKPWPIIGGTLAPSTNLIPAHQRYTDGKLIPGGELTILAMGLPDAIGWLPYNSQLSAVDGTSPYN